MRVLILGLGQFGGGLGATRFFAHHGAQVTVTDLQPAASLQGSLEQLGDLEGIDYRLGEHTHEDLDRAHWIVINPAIPPHAPILDYARTTGARLLTEIGLFLRWCPSPWIAGVSGSNGKSTTVELATKLLRSSNRRVRLAGNIGASLLPDVLNIDPDDRIVLELSSFQLERLSPDALPRVVALTQFAPDNHLDWHGSAERYQNAKESLLGKANVGSSLAVLPVKSPYYDRWRRRAEAEGRRVVPFTADDCPDGGVGYRRGQLHSDLENNNGPLLPTDELTLSGPENRGNIACATAIALSMGGTPEGIATGVCGFRPLEHRQEIIPARGALNFVNDSKATTPAATLCALRAFGPQAILLAGGRFKGDSFEEFATAAHGAARLFFVYGECAGALRQALIDAGADDDAVVTADTLEQAFSGAIHQADDGDTILLSPACASFDQFRDYRERGDRFRSLVMEWCQLIR
ncbi:MAG: UDP-N-acetylmuramoyl-L-alanine--D-glutamate ligase [Planctomycetota bacterium]